MVCIHRFCRGRWLFFLIAGVIAGTVLLNAAMYVGGMSLEERLLSAHRWFAGQDVSGPDLLIQIGICRLVPAFVLAALIRLMGSYYLLYLVVFTFGMSFGYTLSMLSVAYGMRSILFMAAYMFPQYLIYIPLMDRIIRFADRQMGAFRPVDKRKMLAACLLFLAGCLLEAYVNPRILAAVIKIFS